MENIANETVALSSIRFFPKPKDDGRFLKCRGENPELAESVLEDSLLFNVVCKYKNLFLFEHMIFFKINFVFFHVC